MLKQIDRLRQALLILLIMLLVWGAGLANPGWADASAPQEQPAIEQISPRFGLNSSNIPSEKVSQFVSACLQVVALIERREGELQGAETESESLHIEQEIEAEALAIIEQAGLTRQEYLQLLGLANTDPEFGERIAIQLQEATS
jgi:hypothetical protein